MTNKINFITGETYTLAELFSENRFVIIPDLQRDYCWGNHENGLVLGFIDSLIKQYKEQKADELNLGLFYGYETPSNHIQLCDGQQRITTLFLLLGMLNHRTGMFHNNLISDFEYRYDDREPYLSYAIRESSLYFIRDLAYNFFTGNSIDCVDSIRKADWYFADYDLDPSVQSMLAALKTIEGILGKLDNSFISGFGDYLLNKLTFQYYDMETRENGEETFVVINTTGEPLTGAQNLKPLVISAEINKEFKDLPVRWEELENWFWKKRSNGNDTSDVGLEEFLRWVAMIEKRKEKAFVEETLNTDKLPSKKRFQFPYDSISFKTICDYWDALQLLVNMQIVKDNFLSPANGHISQIECFEILPVLLYSQKYYQQLTEKFNNNEKEPIELRRVVEFFRNLARLSNVQKAVNSLVCEAIRIIDLLKDGDILSLLSCDESLLSATLWTTEEKRKLIILKDNLELRSEIEHDFWCAQEHKIWAGEIIPLIEWSTANDQFEHSKFKKYCSIFREVFKGKCDGNIDLVRRALLTVGLYGYPRVFRGYTNISFGWEWEDWKILINDNDNQEKFKEFFDRLINGETLEQMVDNYNGDSEWKRFIKEPDLIKYCGQKKVQRSGDDLLLLTKQRTSAEYKEIKNFFSKKEVSYDALPLQS